MPFPRSAADRIASANFPTRSGSLRRRFRASALPCMIIRRLLKSCATPPVIRPRASGVGLCERGFILAIQPKLAEEQPQEGTD